MSNKIPYGEGWPWPKKEARPGTVYRYFDDHTRDCILLLAIDEDGTRRGVEVDGKLWCMVIRPRQAFAESGVRLSGDEDWETLLQAPEAWTTKKEPPPPTTEELARALFETDYEVQRFVRLVADDMIGDGPHTEWKFGKRHEAMQIAWERNEGGRRKVAELRAVPVIDAINWHRSVRVQRTEQEK